MKLTPVIIWPFLLQYKHPEATMDCGNFQKTIDFTQKIKSSIITQKTLLLGHPSLALKKKQESFLLSPSSLYSLSSANFCNRLHLNRLLPKLVTVSAFSRQLSAYTNQFEY